MYLKFVVRESSAERCPSPLIILVLNHKLGDGAQVAVIMEMSCRHQCGNVHVQLLSRSLSGVQPE